ncbi:hypothetical protein B0H17DRAFT_339921 [Mycena rosella]|uniref:Uncharacterized protein n=1 Tax=Mycena rosella TaxID=1033263 RepID=A0AAD7CRB2_MYCRO|nr:hypothetical protein B0H17DRAFT_339921 [Mycena rosella]
MPSRQSPASPDRPPPPPENLVVVSPCSRAPSPSRPSPSPASPPPRPPLAASPSSRPAGTTSGGVSLHILHCSLLLFLLASLLPGASRTAFFQQPNNIVWTCGESTFPQFTIWINNSDVSLLTAITAIIPVEQNFNCKGHQPEPVQRAPRRGVHHRRD